jgi:alkanesulfonate monooxygenase SsuD/methylene tetrahydromethanopterin reductase-like flavin-dependent oxidoreductase (luciferase family)
VARYGHRAPAEGAGDRGGQRRADRHRPNPVLAVPGRLLVDWARRAEERGFASLARWGAGFTIGGAPPEMAAGAIQEFKAAWEQAGGSGRPRVVVLAYYSLGEEHTEESLHDLRTYYGSLGDWAEQVAPGASRTPDAVRRTAA